MSINSCCSWFVFFLVKVIGKVNTFKRIGVFDDKCL